MKTEFPSTTRANPTAALIRKCTEAGLTLIGMRVMLSTFMERVSAILIARRETVDKDVLVTAIREAARDWDGRDGVPECVEALKKASHRAIHRVMRDLEEVEP